MATKRELENLAAVARATAGTARTDRDRAAFITIAERAEELAARAAAAPAAGLPAEPTEAMVDAGRKAQRVSAERFRAGYRAAAAAFAEGAGPGGAA